MQLLEVGDVARLLNVVPATVRMLARSGRLPVAVTTPRGARLFRAEDVEVLRQARESARKAS